jgi:RNA polymerase sigma-70 factor (ECF subfamily)
MPPRSPPETAAYHGWVRRLRGDAGEALAAMRELHALLLRGARFAVARRVPAPQLRGAELEEIATEAADDALLAVLRHLDDYRGDSRFTTWASKFVFFEVGNAVRRRAWKGREVPLDDGLPLGSDVGPAGEADASELLEELRAALAQALTPHQRLVFVAVCLQGVPIDVLAERLATTRGAVYKTLHDARRKLRARLAADGVVPATLKPPPP